MITQLVIAALGTASLGLMLTGRNQLGLIAALLAQPAWLWTAWKHRQWGVLYIAEVYTIIWGRLLWNVRKSARS